MFRKLRIQRIVDRLAGLSVAFYASACVWPASRRGRIYDHEYLGGKRVLLVDGDLDRSRNWNRIRAEPPWHDYSRRPGQRGFDFGQFRPAQELDRDDLTHF